jgi:hypothetical protein
MIVGMLFYREEAELYGKTTTAISYAFIRVV